MATRTTLASKVAEDLRRQIATGDLAPGARLPNEAQLSDDFGVSRPTIRSALKELEAMSLVHTQHGVGTFVVDRPAVTTGLERLSSITESIRATGKKPSMTYASRLVRTVLPEEASRMEVDGDTQVVELRRAILADGEVIAYSYDLMPHDLFGAGFDLDAVDGSLFALLRDQLGFQPTTGLGEVHAVHSHHVGWGPEAAAHDLFVLLNQLHYDESGRLLLYSRTYFIEGRYSFTIVRSA